MGLRELRTTRAATAMPAAPAGVADWRERLRLAAYALYRRRGDCSAFPREGEIEELVDLIDEGRTEQGAPSSLTRLTAEALGGAIFCQLRLDGGRLPEGELVPMLMYSAVLPYAGAASAADELRIPPPPR